MNKKLLLGLLFAVVAGSSYSAKGSMFDATNYQSLVADQRAFRVGDVLTILIQESSMASSSVDLKAARNIDLELRGQTLGKSQMGLNASVASGNDGGGQTVRSGRVTAQITVTVREVHSNGDLVVDGQQTVDLNGEQQIISVSGRLRPRDISDNNAVLSSRMADAQISYNGKGYIAEKSKPSPLSRLLSFLGL